MGKITALRTGNRGRQVKVFVDGDLSFITDKKTIAEADLQVGRELSARQVEELRQVFLSHNCLDSALHYLSYRPRSEAEIKIRLQQRGFDDDVICETVNALRERGLVDDVAFAEFWRDNRLSFSPRSRGLLKLELRQKGVSAEMATEVVGDMDDEVCAYQAGLKKSHSLISLGCDDFRRYIFGYLRRRGFSYEVAHKVVGRLWHEREATTL